MSPGDVRIDSLRLRELRIPFKTAFKHASATRTTTSSVWVDAIAAGRVVGHGEACPRPYVTQETIESARAFVTTHGESICHRVHDLGSLRSWMDEHLDDIDANPAAWCSVELACLDAFGRSAGETIEMVLGLPPLAETFAYTAVVGDDEPAVFQALVHRYERLGFRDFKVKLSGDLDRDRQKLTAFAPLLERGVRVRADANNLWDGAAEASEALSQLGFSWFAIEEPIRANQYEQLQVLARDVGYPIVLDESLVRRQQFERLSGVPAQWLVNVRVSKMGGLLRSLDVVAEARRRGIGVIVGAQVGETSLLTRAGLTVAHAAADSLVAQEGAFGTHLLEHDVCDPPLMFGARGIIETASFSSLANPGLGFIADPDFPPSALRSRS
jgi:L-alanine-DL-glutamate epimerase-like enolase superfamily enzyme